MTDIPLVFLPELVIFCLFPRRHLYEAKLQVHLKVHCHLSGLQPPINCDLYCRYSGALKVDSAAGVQNLS